MCFTFNHRSQQVDTTKCNRQKKKKEMRWFAANVSFKTLLSEGSGFTQHKKRASANTKRTLNDKELYCGHLQNQMCRFNPSQDAFVFRPWRRRVLNHPEIRSDHASASVTCDQISQDLLKFFFFADAADAASTFISQVSRHMFSSINVITESSMNDRRDLTSSCCCNFTPIYTSESVTVMSSLCAQ